MIPQFIISSAAYAVSLILLIAVPAMAGSLELSLDPATSGPGKFAAEEIHCEAVAKGMTLGQDANATRISLTVERDAKAAAQGYSIRVQNDGGRRVITVRGADAAGAMYGGLDIAEAIRTGTLDSLQDSDHAPHHRVFPRQRPRDDQDLPAAGRLRHHRRRKHARHAWRHRQGKVALADLR